MENAEKYTKLTKYSVIIFKEIHESELTRHLTLLNTTGSIRGTQGCTERDSCFRIAGRVKMTVTVIILNNI